MQSVQFWGGDEHIVHEARAAPEGHPLYCHALLPKATLPRFDPQTPSDAFTTWARGDSGAYITGVVFTDGSVRNSGIRHAERVGWAVVQLDTASNLRLLQQQQQQLPAGQRPGSSSNVHVIRHGHGGSLQAMRDHGFDIPLPSTELPSREQVQEGIRAAMAAQGVNLPTPGATDDHHDPQQEASARDFLEELRDPRAQLRCKVAFVGNLVDPAGLDITAAELYAVYRALLVMVPPLIVVTDAMNVIDA